MSDFIVDGEAPSHARAKELAAAAIGAFIDRTVETKGLDYIDAEKAKRQGTSPESRPSSITGAQLYCYRFGYYSSAASRPTTRSIVRLLMHMARAFIIE